MSNFHELNAKISAKLINRLMIGFERRKKINQINETNKKMVQKGNNFNQLIFKLVVV